MKKLGYAAWFVAWFIISAFVLLPLKPAIIDYGAAYGPAGAAVAGGVFGAFWFAILSAGMVVVRALFDNPLTRNRPISLLERLVALNTWQKCVAGVACGLFVGALVVAMELSVDPEFAARYPVPSQRSVSRPAISSDSLPLAPSGNIPDDKVTVDPPSPATRPPVSPDWLMSGGHGDIHRFTTSAGDIAEVKQLSYSNLDAAAIWNWLTQWYIKKGYRISDVQNVVLDNGTRLIGADVYISNGTTRNGYEYLYLMLNPNGGKWALDVRPGTEGRNTDFDGRLTHLITAMTQWP